MYDLPIASLVITSAPSLVPISSPRTEREPLPIELALYIQSFLPRNSSSSFSTHLALSSVSRTVRGVLYGGQDENGEKWKEICLGAGYGRSLGGEREEKLSWKGVVREVARGVRRRERVEPGREYEAIFSEREQAGLSEHYTEGGVVQCGTARIVRWDRGVRGIGIESGDGREDARELADVPELAHLLAVTPPFASLNVHFQLPHDFHDITILNSDGVTALDFWTAVLNEFTQPLPTFNTHPSSNDSLFHLWLSTVRPYNWCGGGDDDDSEEELTVEEEFEEWVRARGFDSSRTSVSDVLFPKKGCGLRALCWAERRNAYEGDLTDVVWENQGDVFY